MAYDVSGRAAASCCAAAAASTSIGRRGNAVFAQVLNPPSRRSVTLRYGQLQTLGTGGLATEAPSSLSVYEYDSPLPSSTQWNGGVQIALPWSTVVDVEYVGQHGYNIVEGDQPQRRRFRHGVSCRRYQDPTLTPTTPGATSVPTDQMRAFRGLQRDHAERSARLGHASLAADLVQPPLPQRPVVRLQRHDRPVEHAAARRRACSTTRTASVTLPRRSGPGGRRSSRRRRPSHDEGATSCGICRT